MRRQRRAAGKAVANEFGSIETGRAANLVVWNGDPFELTTLPERLWFNGLALSMRSRRTELRDRYLKRNKEGSVR